MTAQEDRLHTLVDEMLADAGHDGDAGLRRALESIGSLATLPVPEPTGELAALLAGPGDELARRRRAGWQRPTVVGLAVIAGMGLGIGGVAATSGGGAAGSSAASVQQLLEDWSPGGIFAPGTLTGDAPEFAGAAAIIAAQAPATDPAAVPSKGPGGGQVPATGRDGAGKDRAAKPNPERKPGCGNGRPASPATIRAAACPPAAGPDRGNGQPGAAGNPRPPAGNRASENDTKTGQPGNGAAGSTWTGADAANGGNRSGGDAPGRAAGNNGASDLSGTDPAGLGQGRTGTGNNGTGNSGSGNSGTGNPGAGSAGQDDDTARGGK